MGKTHLTKGLVFSIYTALSKLNNKKKNSPVETQAENVNGNFILEDAHMANTSMKRGSTPVISKEMQIKTAVRRLCTGTRAAKVKKIARVRCWTGVRSCPSCLVGTENGRAALGKFGSSF